MRHIKPLVFANFKEAWEVLKNSERIQGQAIIIHTNVLNKKIFLINLGGFLKEIVFLEDNSYDHYISIEFETYAEAQAAALSVGIDDSLYYFGEYIAVRENSKLYIIGADRSLIEVK